MSITEIKKEARESLRGKWGKAIKVVLAYTLLSFLVGLVQGFVGEESLLYAIIDLAFTIISIPLSFGLIISFIKLKRDEDIKAFDFVNHGFSNFGKSWGIAWRTFLKMLLPIMCFVLILLLIIAMSIYNTNIAITNRTLATPTSSILNILFIILEIATVIYVVSRGLLYTLSYYIAYDNQELSSKDAILKSEELMKGNRGNYFLLQLSFIGWIILSCFTLGIGMLWVMPYIAIAEVCFYERVAKLRTQTIEEEVKMEE